MRVDGERCCAAPRVMERHGAKWCDAYIVNTHAYTVNQALDPARQWVALPRAAQHACALS